MTSENINSFMLSSNTSSCCLNSWTWSNLFFWINCLKTKFHISSWKYLLFECLYLVSKLTHWLLTLKKSLIWAFWWESEFANENLFNNWISLGMRKRTYTESPKFLIIFSIEKNDKILIRKSPKLRSKFTYKWVLPKSPKAMLWRFISVEIFLSYHTRILKCLTWTSALL